MAIRLSPIPEGTRVRVRQSTIPVDPGVAGRAGVVVFANDYRAERIGVVLDGETRMRIFLPSELEIVEERPLAPERESAKARRALP